MTIHTDFLKFISSVQSFISTIFNKEIDQKLDDLGQLKIDLFVMNKKLDKFFPHISDGTEVDKKSDEIVYIKKFYLELLKNVEKMITRFDEKFKYSLDMEQNYIKNYD